MESTINGIAMDVPFDILTKLERFCAFQERCEADVRKKLFAMPISVAQRDEIVHRLKENDFLNEERYTETFIRGKMHENQWGKIKIMQALLAKGVDGKLVNEKLSQIDETEYTQQLISSIEKWKRMNSADQNNRSKLIKAMLTKGYAMNEILNLLK